MNHKRLNINENYSFRSSTSIISSYQSSLCSQSHVEIERSLDELSTTTYTNIQNTTIIAIDRASYTTFVVPAEPTEDQPITDNSCADDNYYNLDVIRNCLNELRNALDNLDTSALKIIQINESDNPRIAEEDITCNDEFAEDLKQCTMPVNNCTSPVVKKSTISLSPVPQRKKKQRKKVNRTSIVDLYCYYDYEWKRFKYPGEDPHMKERWKVHKKFFHLR